MTITREHQQRGGNAKNSNTDAPVMNRRARQVKCRLFQNDLGEWFVQIGDGQTFMYATDVEVSLWLELQEIKRGTNHPK